MSTAAIRIIAEDIKIAHSVFALPFAMLGAFMAASTVAEPGSFPWSGFIGPLFLVALAMVFARTSAMLSNRILDARIDAGNPRTAGRAIPSGRLPMATARLAFAASSAGFLVICVLFGVLHGNWWPTILGVPVLSWICAYGLFKRFTWFCHVWLGMSLGLSPIAAAIAIEPSALSGASIWLLSGMVVCWVAGFDVIYALQDVEVDERDGLFSIPARFGTQGALSISRLLHVLAVILLTLTWQTEPGFGNLFLAAVVLVAILLLVEHATVKSWGTTRMALTFVTLNGVVSIVVGLAGITDLLNAS